LENENLESFEKVRDYFKDGLAYHIITTPNGQKLKGRWDITKYIKYYQIPEDLSNKTVLDIGPAEGFFSFEMEKRGADVTAIDSYFQDYREELCQLMKSNVKFVVKDLLSLNERFGKFDIVFCSNVLQHNLDWFGNFQRIRSVTKEKAIICTSFVKTGRNDIPILYFVGDADSHEQRMKNQRKFIVNEEESWQQKDPSEEKHIGEYWRPNIKCLIEMAKAAGFKKVKEISTFEIQREDDNRVRTNQVVIHCYV